MTAPEKWLAACKTGRKESDRRRREGRREESGERARQPAAGHTEWAGETPLRGSARCKDAGEPILPISKLWGARHQKHEGAFCLTKVAVMLISGTCHPWGSPSPPQAPSCSKPNAGRTRLEGCTLSSGKQRGVACRRSSLRHSLSCLYVFLEGSAQPRDRGDASGQKEVARGMFLALH